MSENVKIPLSLLDKTIDLLEWIDVNNFGSSFSALHDYVLSAFRIKKQKLDLRQSYAKIIFADNDDDRFDARMDYLQKKRNIEDDFF